MNFFSIQKGKNKPISFCQTAELVSLTIAVRHTKYIFPCALPSTPLVKKKPELLSYAWLP